MKGFVYILRSLKDKKLYIGSTTNVVRRLNEHNKKYVRSTKSRTPFSLMHVLEYDDISVTRKMEILFKRSHSLLTRELKQRGVAQG